MRRRSSPEADAYEQLVASGNSSILQRRHLDASHDLEKRSGSWWMGNMNRMGGWPWGNSSSFKVFRDVTTYGAVGDGVTVSSWSAPLLCP